MSPQHRNRQQRRAKASAGSSSAAAQQPPGNAPVPFAMPMPPHTRQDSGFNGWRAVTPPPHSAHATHGPSHSFSQQPGQSVSLPPGAFPGAYPFWPQPPAAFSPTPNNMPPPRHTRGESTHTSKRQRYQGDAPIGLGHPQHPSVSNVTNIDHRSNPSATLRNRANLALLTDIQAPYSAGPVSPALGRPPMGAPGPPPGTPPALLPYAQRASTLDSAGIQSLGHFPHSSLSLPLGSPVTRTFGGGTGPIPPPSPVTRRAVTQPSQLSQSHTRSASTQQRLGPPPKAILGGPGGRTFDELRPSPGSSLKPTPTPSATSRSSSPLAASALRQASSANSTQSDSEATVSMASEAATKAAATVASKEAITRNGNTIQVALPPAKYSPPDSPAVTATSPEKQGTAEGEEKDAKDAEPTERVPRKEAYPWPPMNVGVTPHSIPLPLSPISDDLSEVEKAFSPVVATPPPQQAKYKVVTWKGKEVRVAMPDEGAWGALRPSESVQEGAGAQPETENADNPKTSEITNSPSTSASIQMGSNPITPPTRETSIHTSPPGSSQWETAFDSSPPFNSPPAFTAWEGPPTRSVTPSDDGPAHRISPIAEENPEAEQLEQASDKTETASATSDTVANDTVATDTAASDNLAVPGGMPAEDPAPATAKPKLYSEEGGPVVQPEEHAALREVALGVETPAVTEGDDGGQTVVLDRLMSSIASPMPSPFRKSFAGLATNPFLKRSLGGMLRPSRSRRGSDAVPPTPTRLTQSTTTDEAGNQGGDAEAHAADTAAEQADAAPETSPERNTAQDVEINKAAPSTPPAQDSNAVAAASPKSLPTSPSSQMVASASPQRQVSESTSPRHFDTRSPPLQLASPPPPRQQFAPSASSPQSRNPSPTRQFASPSPTRQFAIPSPPRAMHINQASIDRAMASDSLAEAVAAMSLAEAQAQAEAQAPRPVTVIRSPQPPSTTTHWAFGPRRPSAQSNADEGVTRSPLTPTSAADNRPLSWRDRTKAVSPPLNRDLQQLINPDGAMLKLSERTRQDEGDQDEPVISADEELKGDADATIPAERPPTGAAAPKASQRGSQVTSDDTNEAAAASQPSSPNVSTTPINSPPALPASSPSKPSPFKSSPVRSFPTVPTENQNAQPGGLSPPKRLQATSATFVPRTMLSTTPETQPVVHESHPFSMSHAARISDASSTFTFGPPSVQPSPIKPHKQMSSVSSRFRPTALTFQPPPNADPMPHDAAATANGMGNGALGLFTFPQKLRPNAIEFRPGGLAAKTRFSPGSGSGPGQGFRPPALDLSAAGPSSRAFAAFPAATTTLGKPFEFTPAVNKPSLVVIRKPNPIPILKPKDAESPTTSTKPTTSPVRQFASPRNDDAAKAEQPPPSEAGAEDPVSTGSPRDSPRRRQHTAKRSSQNSHLPRVFSERSQPSTPVDSVPGDVQIHQSKPIRLDAAVGHMVRASSDGVLQSTGGQPLGDETSKTSDEANGASSPAAEGSKMTRTVSAPTVLSAKAKPFVLSGGQYSQSVSDSAKRLDAFLHHNPHISNHNSEVADENKFRHWVFPRPETHSRSPSSEDPRPLSHKRRHEDTEEDAQADDESGGDDGSVDAEETSKWSNWPRATEVLSPESNTFTTTDTSAEFPMRRTPPRRLSVINTTTPPRAPSPTPGGITTPIVLPRAMLVEMLTTMKGVGEQVVQSRSDHQRLLEESTKRAEAAAKQSAVATETLEKIREFFAQPKPVDNVAGILEAHTTLLQEIHQKIEDETRTSTADSAELADRTLVADAMTTPHEMLTAILSGQHAMMSKFSDFTDAQEVVYDLRSATDALLEAQAEARQVKIDQKHGHEMVRLHDELRDEVAKTAQAEREVAALKAKLDAAEKAAKSKELEDVWRALIRADVAAATAALAKITSAEEHAREELNEMREQLARQNTAHQTAIDALKHERDAAAKLAEDRHKELVEHQASAETFRGKLLERLDGLGHTFERELEKKRGEAELEREALARERIAALEKEVHDLRAELVQAAADRSDLRVQLTQAVADVRFEQEKAIRMADTEANAKRTMELQLKAEKARASYLETKMQRAEADVNEVASNLDAWRSAALEQRLRAEQATTHVSALQQENFHWRQFALGADRHRLEQWLATRPFEGIDEVKARSASAAKQPPEPASRSPSPTKSKPVSPARPSPASPASPASSVNSVSPVRSILSPARPASPASPSKHKDTTPAVSSKLRMEVPLINEPEDAE